MALTAFGVHQQQRDALHAWQQLPSPTYSGRHACTRTTSTPACLPAPLPLRAAQVIEPNPNLIQAWLLTTGTLLCAEQSFMDYAGWSAEELVGKAFSSLGADSSELDE